MPISILPRESAVEVDVKKPDTGVGVAVAEVHLIYFVRITEICLNHK